MNATRICEAKFGTVFRFDGRRFHLAAGTDLPPEFAEFARKRGAFEPEAGTQLDTVLRTKSTTQLYFKGDPYIAKDPWAGRKPSMAIPLQQDGTFLRGTFDVVLARGF